MVAFIMDVLTWALAVLSPVLGAMALFVPMVIIIWVVESIIGRRH